MQFLLVFALLFTSLFANIAKPLAARDFSSLIGMKGFSDEALKLHFKLYEGYVKNANTLLEELDALLDSGKEKSLDYGALKRRLMWEYDGARLHEYYFENLGGKGGLDSSSPLYKALDEAWRGFDNWKRDFVATGSMRGIGWVVLYRDPESGRLINAWINEHDRGHLPNGEPILIMDVFEHAYLLDYGIDRAKYIEAFFNNVNWDIVSKRFAK